MQMYVVHHPSTQVVRSHTMSQQLASKLASHELAYLSIREEEPTYVEMNNAVENVDLTQR